MNASHLCSIFTLLLLTGIAHPAMAQKPTPTGRNQSTYHANQDTVRVADIRERLVQLALQNPGFEIADRRVGVAEYELRKAKGSWLGLFNAAGNLNELSIKPADNTPGINNVYYPRYNFGVTLPFDFFTNKSNDVKIARERLYIAEAEKNEHYRLVRREVLSKYEDYLMNKEKLELQVRMTQAEYTEYKMAEKDFEDGLIMSDAFKKAESTYYMQLMTKSEYQRNFNVVKLELEEMIGVSIDDVLMKK